MQQSTVVHGRGTLELSISIYRRNRCSTGRWFAVKARNLNFVCCMFVWRESSFVMDKLKGIENAISENDFNKIDERKDCL